MARKKVELTVDTVIAAWVAETEKREAENPTGVWRGEQFSYHALQLLKRGQPVTPEQLAEASGMKLVDVERTFADIKQQGGELDEAGNLVGLALTLIPTRHKFTVNNQQLYTWCALDAVFMPGLLGDVAQVSSTCPITNYPISLTISPTGIEAVEPATTVLSITIPGISCRCEDDEPTKAKTGPKSDGCSQMLFFASEQAANQWLNSHPGVALFSPEEAYQLANANWISRQRTA